MISIDYIRTCFFWLVWLKYLACWTYDDWLINLCVSKLKKKSETKESADENRV